MIILTILSGAFLFLGAGGMKIPAQIFAWFAILPLLALIRRSESPKVSFRRGWLAGFLFFLAQISWFLSAAPLDWAGINNPYAGIAIITIVWLASSLVLGFFVGGFAYLLKRVSPDAWWYAAPMLWIIFEYARAWGFGLFWVGYEGALGPYWTFGVLGYASVFFRPLLNFSKIAGIYGGSFIFVFFSSVLYHYFSRILEKKRRESATWSPNNSKPMYSIIALAIFIAVFYFWQNFYPERGIYKTVALIQTNFPQKFDLSENFFLTRARDGIRQLKQSRVSPKGKQVDLAVLPEGSLVTTFWGGDSIRKIKEIFVYDRPFLLIDAERVLRNEPSPERIYLFDSRKGLAGYRDKEFLIPLGEYLPYSVRAIATLLGKSDWIGAFEKARGHASDSPPPPEFDLSPKEEGVLACSGILAPDLYYDLVGRGARVLINTASQSAFKGNPLFTAQGEQMIRLIAASSDRFLAQSANGGVNYIIDNNGFVAAKSAGLGFETLIGAAEYRNTKTMVVRLGNWPVWLSLLILAWKFRVILAKKTRGFFTESK